ncbi:MAG: hypothetical protein E5V92_01985 [Mesorhizobium sp.]|uniref:hypothetical protein n=1 Tax=unclassified Mesorhizobium TaxID=325217 RepID=UPI000F7655A6|nr:MULTISPECIES: hypothetical protein [unclassified Mesorhizobium]AZO75014.1 hypothetical protein EJ067_30470 [Mesorhizobium sp. M1D.F.Ca.ET.043.01.1.1]RWA96115.1 MAG: hypothetical protein EOQ32_00405 [Mesorhizobium sp.]TJW90394.1 MAG: hypothetical protein E5V92_01985 [Mesorhizobium sp.]
MIRQTTINTTDHAGEAPRLEEAVAWFREHHLTCERPFVPALRRRFGLSPLEAINVMRFANLREDWGGADAAP